MFKNVARRAKNECFFVMIKGFCIFAPWKVILAGRRFFFFFVTKNPICCFSDRTWACIQGWGLDTIDAVPFYGNCCWSRWTTGWASYERMGTVTTSRWKSSRTRYSYPDFSFLGFLHICRKKKHIMACQIHPSIRLSVCPFVCTSLSIYLSIMQIINILRAYHAYPSFGSSKIIALSRFCCRVIRTPWFSNVETSILKVKNARIGCLEHKTTSSASFLDCLSLTLFVAYRFH